nr:hypothetical protein GCM10017611_12550 [Rhodococcus wratislaviensis]
MGIGPFLILRLLPLGFGQSAAGWESRHELARCTARVPGALATALRTLPICTQRHKGTHHGDTR